MCGVTFQVNAKSNFDMWFIGHVYQPWYLINIKITLCVAYIKVNVLLVEVQQLITVNGQVGV